MDIVEGLENSVRQPVLPHELPDIFLAVEFGCAWRELQERDVVWNLEGLGAMPAGLIEEENSVSARSDFGCDLIEVKLHSFGVAAFCGGLAWALDHELFAVAFAAAAVTGAFSAVIGLVGTGS